MLREKENSTVQSSSHTGPDSAEVAAIAAGMFALLGAAGAGPGEVISPNRGESQGPDRLGSNGRGSNWKTPNWKTSARREALS